MQHKFSTIPRCCLKMPGIVFNGKLKANLHSTKECLYLLIFFNFPTFFEVERNKMLEKLFKKRSRDKFNWHLGSVHNETDRPYFQFKRIFPERNFFLLVCEASAYFIFCVLLKEKRIVFFAAAGIILFETELIDSYLQAFE